MKLIPITRRGPDKSGGNDNQNADPESRPVNQQLGIWGLKSRLVPKSKNRFNDALRTDMFPEGNRGALQATEILTIRSVDKLIDPATSREARLAHAIKEIETKKAGTLDLDFIEKILSTDSFECRKNTLWLGVCYRLRGKNPSSVLEPLLTDERFSRTALVNVCAYHAARSVDIEERSTFNETVRMYLEKLDVHVRFHKWDRFARLVQALLLFRVHEQPQAIQMLENLYLDQRKYSPAISVLASLLNLKGRRAAAEDFAMEALSIDPTNSQAAAILAFHGSLPDHVKFIPTVIHLPFTIISRYPQSILFDEYGKLDSTG